MSSGAASAAAQGQRPALLLALTLAMHWGAIVTDVAAAETEEMEQGIVDGAGHHFDVSLFRGASVSTEVIARIARAEVPPGKYTVDVYVNGRFVDSSEVWIARDERSGVQACLASPLVKRAGLVLTPEAMGQATDSARACVRFEHAITGGAARFDLSRLRLDLDVPNVSLVSVPRGHVDIEALDAGMTLAYANYGGSYYRVSHGTRHQDFGYLLLDMGFNAAGWQLRQQSNVSHGGGGTGWRTLRQYVQRPLPTLGSQLVLGETFTNGRILSGLAYTGISLSSDERMLPDSMRGYAPTVRGIAMTRARVSIRQHGHEIHQLTVAPGPFEVKDLYPTSFNGDLEVEVTEADGNTWRFTVPFSAVPESLRPGSSRYSMLFGRTRDMGQDSLFVEGSYRHGISNRVTGLAALRLSSGYQTAASGGTFTSGLGTLGLNVAYARAELPEMRIRSGWMAHASYSRTFSLADTTLSLASYRYSTEGYLDLADVLGLREATRQGWQWTSSGYSQRQRFELMLNQPLGRYGMVFGSGSTQRYRDGRSCDSQFQLGYGNSFANGLSLNLALARQRSQMRVPSLDWRMDGGSEFPSGIGWHASDRRDTTVSLSLSIPLGRAIHSRVPSLTTSYVRSGAGDDQYQTSLSGMADGAQTLSYSLGAAHSRSPSRTTVSGSFNKRMPRLALGMNASRGDGYWQAGASLQGAVVAHAGGITFGPYLGDTFGLVEAKGAQGARVTGNHGLHVDRRGYALLPALTPYRFNSISLEPLGLDKQVELLDGTQRVAPYAGAGAKLVFRTRGGLPLLIATGSEGVTPVPMGAEVFDAAGSVVGVTGQGGQVYARVREPMGVLDVRWGPDAGKACRIRYDVRGHGDDALVRLDAACADK